MSEEMETRPEAGVIKLFAGVITDVHRLMTQQLALFRHEIQGDFNRVRDAGSLVAVGLTIVAIGGVNLCDMLALLVARIVPDVPLWACYGAVGALVSVIGATLCLIGAKRLRAVNSTAVAVDRMTGASIDG